MVGWRVLEAKKLRKIPCVLVGWLLDSNKKSVVEEVVAWGLWRVKGGKWTPDTHCSFLLYSIYCLHSSLLATSRFNVRRHSVNICALFHFRSGLWDVHYFRCDIERFRVWLYERTDTRLCRNLFRWTLLVGEIVFFPMMVVLYNRSLSLLCLCLLKLYVCVINAEDIILDIL